MTYPKTFDEGAFVVDKTPHGYQSTTREGNKLIFSGTEHECEYWSRLYLKANQEDNWFDDANVVNSGVVGGKL
jgi:hypothetical protein